jgi:hypothetical protein
MKLKRLGIVSLFVLVVTAVAGTRPLLSHHSHAMFDHTSEVTITGTVKTFSYRNPHVFLYLAVESENGEVTTWAIEMSNIHNMLRRGVNASTFKVGDVLAVTLNPLTSGEPGGNYLTVQTADGVVYND